jgi:MFS family permease
MKDDLEFSYTFITILQTIGYVTMGFGSILYASIIKYWPRRNAIAFGTIGLSIVGVLDIILVLHLNREVGISDEITAIGGDVV